MTGKERIAEQSRQWLWAAFLELLADKDYTKITISEIAQQAQLDRRTFYRSFKDKQDLIDWYMHHTLAAYRTMLSKNDPTTLTLADGITQIFNFWWQQRATLSPLIKNGLATRFLIFLEQDISDWYASFNAAWHIDGSPAEIDYLLTYSTGGLWNVIQRWLSSETPRQPADMAAIMIKALKQVSTTIE